ncbi:MAG: ParB/RepB/Spo0J family partition protein [Deltaproteobacteria bacterium]|nr:ParB/RepB/Spo0J family partition protein [Deltaproteobacteria bacterium]
METTQAGNKQGEPLQVPIGLIDADETNVRSRLQGTEDLAASIRAHGIIQPLVGTRDDAGRIKLIAGHRRLAAAKLAALATVPVIVRSVEASVAKEIQLVENVQREDLPALDVADALRAMIDGGQNVDSVATRVGKSAAWVRRHLALLKLDDKVLAAVKKHGLRFTQAEQVAKVLKTGSLEAAIESARAMASGHVSRRAVERSIAAKDGEPEHRHTLSARGASYRATLTIESTNALDDVQGRQLRELVGAIERIMGRDAEPSHAGVHAP